MAITKKQVIEKLTVAEARSILEAAVKRENAATEKRNKAFQSLPQYKQRITIAQDVLAQTAARRFVASFGTYLEVKGENAYDIESKIGDSDVHEPLDRTLAGAKCEVCGIGSLFVAAIDRANQCMTDEMSSIDDSGFMRDYLNKWFDRDQLAMIETAFEGRLINEDDTDLEYSSPEIERSIAFTSRLSDATARLKKIMKNIVDNRGKFVP